MAIYFGAAFGAGVTVVTTDKVCYCDPARFALDAHLTELSELATNVDKHSWPQYIRLYEVDPATPIECEVQDPDSLMRYMGAQQPPPATKAPATSTVSSGRV